MKILDKGLPIFVAYGGEKNGVYRYDDCRDLHWWSWRYPTPRSSGAEFIHVTVHYPSGTCEVVLSVNDMNVERNDYNKTFAFSTRAAAERYMQSTA